MLYMHTIGGDAPANTPPLRQHKTKSALSRAQVIGRFDDIPINPP
jgi:hypothetical protein